MITLCSSSLNELHQFSRIKPTLSRCLTGSGHSLSQFSWQFESESTVCSLKAETILVSNYFQKLFSSVAGCVVFFERHTRVLCKYHTDLCNVATGAVALQWDAWCEKEGMVILAAAFPVFYMNPFWKELLAAVGFLKPFVLFNFHVLTPLRGFSSCRVGKCTMLPFYNSKSPNNQLE